MPGTFGKQLQQLALSGPLSARTTLITAGTAGLAGCILAVATGYLLVSQPVPKLKAEPLPEVKTPTDFTSTLGSGSSAERAIVLLQAYAQSQHVDVQSLARHEDEGAPGLSATTFDFKLKGSYPSIKAVLASMLGQLANARVTRLDIATNDAASAVTATVTLTVWTH